MSDGGAGAEATLVSVLLRPDEGGKRKEEGTTRERLAGPVPCPRGHGPEGNAERETAKEEKST